MNALTRKQNAENVITSLRATGPMSVAEIQSTLGMSKREVEDALWLLGSSARVEYDYPVSSPLVYKATNEAPG